MKQADQGRAVCASPSEDLLQHQCLRFTAGRLRIWELTDGQRTFNLEVRGRLQANDLMMLRNIAAQGGGVAMLPVFICQEEMAQKRLLRLLPLWSSSLNPVHLVYPNQRFVPAHLTAFLDVVGSALRAALAC